MTKPLMNLDDVEFDDIEDNGFYTSRRGRISQLIGARRLGYNLTVLPPGKAQCPFHSHRAEEEMFLILEGEGELRFGERRYPIRRHDVIACPTGGPEVAHQIINTGAVTMRYVALSTLADVEACEYPDSQKVGIFTGQSGERGLRKLFRAEQTVDYYDREDNPQDAPRSDRPQATSEAPGPARTKGGGMTRDSNDATAAMLDAFAAAWNRHDDEALMTFMTDDCVFESSAGPDVCGTRYAGREAVRAGFVDVWQTFPDAHWGHARHFVDGDRGVSQWTFTGTRRDGTRVEVHGCDLFTFRDGKIALKDSYRKSRAPR